MTRKKKNDAGFALASFVVAFPLLAGVLGAAGAGSLVLSRYRSSLGTCRSELLAAVLPLEKAALRLQRMNPQALLFARRELGIRARLAACGTVPITCVEPAAQMARLMIQMKKFNHSRHTLRAQAETMAHDYQRRLQTELLRQGNSIVRRSRPAKLSFDHTPALVTTPAWVMGPQFEDRTTIRQTFEFPPLKHVPHWLVGLLGPDIRWNTISAQCAATLKTKMGKPYRSLSAARPSWNSAL